jgi:hypothetical protein
LPRGTREPLGIADAAELDKSVAGFGGVDDDDDGLAAAVPVSRESWRVRGPAEIAPDGDELAEGGGLDLLAEGGGRKACDEVEGWG